MTKLGEEIEIVDVPEEDVPVDWPAPAPEPAREPVPA